MTTRLASWFAAFYVGSLLSCIAFIQLFGEKDYFAWLAMLIGATFGCIMDRLLVKRNAF